MDKATFSVAPFIVFFLELTTSGTSLSRMQDVNLFLKYCKKQSFASFTSHQQTTELSIIRLVIT
jgi:hypothetical protein